MRKPTMKDIFHLYMFLLFGTVCFSQDISMINLKGSLPATYLNPALSIEKKWNIHFGGFNILANTDGPSINQLTSTNSAGQRYIDIKTQASLLSPTQNMSFNYEVHTLDISYRLPFASVMVGHAFKSSGNLRYSDDLISLISEGNAPYIGQKLDIGPKIDIYAYNEFYFGLQKSIGKLSLGAKAKLLFGSASIYTESNKVDFTTSDQYYQWQFDTDYTLRSSALLRYTSLDSITLDYATFSFDNVFYNNSGLAIDIGATYQLNKNVLISLSATDIGKINWDYFPRKYTSKGTYTFEGIDVVEYLSDSTSISIQDTLLDILKVTKGLENYSTSLNASYAIGASYQLGSSWTFNGLLSFKNNFGQMNQVISLSALKKIKALEMGLQYTASKNNPVNVGLFTRLKLGSFSAYISTQNVVGLFSPLTQKNASLRLGGMLQF